MAANPLRPLLILVALVLATLLAGPTAHGATISADFGSREAPTLRLGFLHNLSQTAPGDELLTPLKPTAWRSSEASAPADRVRRLGAAHTIVLSDSWSYPVREWRPVGPPWSQLQRFGAWVRQVARRHRDAAPQYWDVWNEPDYGVFWDGTREDYYETFAIAERALREELGPDVRIVAPSTTRWRLDWIKGLAEFCLQRGCRFDAVSWHDLPNDMRSLPQLSERIARTRALLSRPRYRPLDVGEIHVNEIMGERIQFKPGAAVGYFSELEHGRADVAIKSCWPDSSQRVNCKGQTLDGLLDWDTGRPRALWHTWRAYADGRSSRIRSHSSDPRVAVLGSQRSRHRGVAQLLLGNVGSPDRHAVVRLCGLRVLTPGHGDARRAGVQPVHHPDLGEAVFTPTPSARVRRLHVEPGGGCAQGRLELPRIGAALLVYLRVR